jgi:uncharacterized lipoprotein
MFKKTFWAILGVLLLMNFSACAESNRSVKNQGPDLSSKHPHPPAPLPKNQTEPEINR